MKYLRHLGRRPKAVLCLLCVQRRNSCALSCSKNFDIRRVLLEAPRRLSRTPPILGKYRVGRLDNKRSVPVQRRYVQEGNPAALKSASYSSFNAPIIPLFFAFLVPSFNKLSLFLTPPIFAVATPLTPSLSLSIDSTGVPDIIRVS